MKVKDLIEALQAVDGDREITHAVYDRKTGGTNHHQFTYVHTCHDGALNLLTCQMSEERLKKLSRPRPPRRGPVWNAFTRRWATGESQ
jgi:hypothetical protein